MSTALKIDQTLSTNLLSELQAMAAAKGIAVDSTVDLMPRIEQALNEIEEDFSKLAEKYAPEILAGVHHSAPKNLDAKPDDGSIAGWIKVPLNNGSAIFTNRFLTDLSRTEPHVEWENHRADGDGGITQDKVFTLADATVWAKEPLTVLGSQDKPNQTNALVLLQREGSNKVVAVNLDHYQYFASKFNDSITLHTNANSNLVQVLSNGQMVGMIATASPARYMADLNDFKLLESLKAKIFEHVYGNDLAKQAQPVLAEQVAQAAAARPLEQPVAQTSTPPDWRSVASPASEASEPAADADLMDDLDAAFPEADMSNHDGPSDLIAAESVATQQAPDASPAPDVPADSAAISDAPRTIEDAIQNQAPENSAGTGLEELSNSDLDAVELAAAEKANSAISGLDGDMEMQYELGPSVAQAHPFISKDDYHKLVLHRLSEAVSQEHAALMIRQETYHLTRSQELAEQQAKFFRDWYEYAEAHNFDALGVACSRVIQKVVDFKNSGQSLKIPSPRDTFVKSLDTIAQVADEHKLSADAQVAPSAGMSMFKRNSTISQLESVADNIPDGPSFTVVEPDKRFDQGFKADPAYLATQAKDAMFRTMPEDVIIDGNVDTEWAETVTKKVNTIKEKLISSSLGQDVRDHINKMMDAIMESLKNLINVAQLIVGKLLPSKEGQQANASDSPAPSM